jgi:hypothetical protein
MSSDRYPNVKSPRPCVPAEIPCNELFVRLDRFLKPVASSKQSFQIYRLPMAFYLECLEPVHDLCFLAFRPINPPAEPTVASLVSEEAKLDANEGEYEARSRILFCFAKQPDLSTVTNCRNAGPTMTV